MRSTRSSLVARCGAAILLVVSAAACSSAASTPPAGAQGSADVAVAGATVGAVGQGQGGGAGSVNDGLGHPVNVCSLLPVATVASIAGEPFTVATEDDTLAAKAYVCDYTSADGTSELRITVEAMGASAGYDSALQAAGTGAKQISGLGDKANSSILGLDALFGNVSITVSNPPSDAVAETTIRTLQPKL
jgi:hypothetical protein